RACANRLCSQKTDQGAIARMNPDSRKYAANSRRLTGRMSASRLALGEPLHARGDVAVFAAVGLQFEEDGQGARRLAGGLEQRAQLVEQLPRVGGARRRRFR